tara:strand:+ start:1394 stop:2371 length:978 start_codon:yes stop_codon:yes gene_type:complete
MSNKKIGLFVIPIKVNSDISTYNDYLNFLVKIEDFGYTHVYIGEHLTDSKEDIQSAIVFAAALLARTKRLIICLSVLPLPHYNIPLLVKQLEDLYLLSKGRLKIGVSQGALASDLEYLNIKKSDRSDLYIKKLMQFSEMVSSSKILKEIYPHNIFSTLLSIFPFKSKNLYSSGYSALSSNFCNSIYLENHIKTFIAGSIDKKNILNYQPKWNIGLNLVPNQFLLTSPRRDIEDSLLYIYKKLENCGAPEIMHGYSPPSSKRKEDISSYLFDQLCFSEIPKSVKELVLKYEKYFDHFVVNLFDCINDPCYTDFILKIPESKICETN